MGGHKKKDLGEPSDFEHYVVVLTEVWDHER
jgi:hypothetical protein